MYTWKVMFSLFCCVVVLVGHGVWWVITGSGHPERLTVWGGGLTSCLATGFSWHGKKKRKTTELDT